MLVVHLVVAGGFIRLYGSGGALGDLFAFCALASMVTITVRRTHLSPALAATTQVVGAILVTTWLLFPTTSGWGLPSGDTFSAAVEALDEAGRVFRNDAPPVAPLIGFQLLAGLGLWAAVCFADWAAFRLNAVLEALAPATVIYIFVSVVGSGPHQLMSAAAFAASALVFVATARGHLAVHDRSWMGSTAVDGARALRRAALITSVLAVAAAAAVAPVMTALTDQPLVRWRETTDQGNQRDTVSPIVDLHRRLVRQSDRVMFTVRSTAPSYWRLTSLDHFDGQIWSASAEFAEAGSRLPSSAPKGLRTRRVIQDVEVVSLASLWAPAAFEARELPRASGPLLWDSKSSTLIVDDELPTSDGLSYEVTSEVPVLDPEVLRAAAGSEPDELRSTYLQLPDDLPARVRAEARQAVLGLTNRYDKARALQDFFHTDRFRYSTDIAEGHGNDALIAFLDSGVGYCEQFAGTYAAMARSLGLPTRVAVGFTPGDADPQDPTFYRVRGLHAHAWPEVHFPGVGWVPFEPTKGRGMPGAEAHTGLAAQQDHSRDTTPLTTTTTTLTTSPSAPSTATTVPPPPRRGTSSPTSDPDPPPNKTVSTLLALLGVVLAGVLVLILAAPWIRSILRPAPKDTRGRVLRAWSDAQNPVRWRTGVVARGTETHHEVAARAQRDLGQFGADFGELATLADEAAWSASVPTEHSAARAEVLSATIRDGVRSSDPLSVRVRRRLSWREALGRF